MFVWRIHVYRNNWGISAFWSILYYIGPRDVRIHVVVWSYHDTVSWMRIPLRLKLVRIAFSVSRIRVSTGEGFYNSDAHCIVVFRVMDHFRALGCVVTKTAVKRKLEDVDIDPAAASSSSSSSSRPISSCTAVLKIPLNFPNPKRGKRRN